MAAFLLGETLAQRLHQLIEPQLLQFGALFRRKIALDQLLQPFLRDFGRLDRLRNAEDPFEHLSEGDVESVEVALVLDQHRARQTVEVVDRLIRDLTVERAQKVEIFARGDRHARLAQFGEKVEKHECEPSAGQGF